MKRALVVVVLLVGGVLAVGVARFAPRSPDRILRALEREGVAPPPDSVHLLGRLPDVLVESSGVAVSRAHDGVLWTHNDSGDGPTVYAVDGSARLLGAWNLTGASAVDWEDIALGSCPGPATDDCLYVADTGDNLRRRDTLTVYVAPEPDPASGGGEVPSRRVRFVYPDGRHDAEALALSPAGDLIVVTKGRVGPSLLFVLPSGAVAEAVSADTVVVLPGGRPLPFTPDFRVGRQVTGGGLDAAGGLLAVRTYSELFVYRWPVGAAWVEAGPPCLLIGVDRGGEGVAFAADGSLLLTSEGSRAQAGTLVRVRCPPSDRPAPRS